MLQTIEVETDPGGHIHPLEPLALIPAGRAYLTLLPTPNKKLFHFHFKGTTIRRAAPDSLIRRAASTGSGQA